MAAGDPTGQVVLRAVDWVSADDVYAAGLSEIAPDVYRNVLTHWNGSEWTDQEYPMPPADTFGYGLSLSDAGPSDVWEVGIKQLEQPHARLTLGLHLGPSGWRLKHLQNPSPEMNELYAVSALDHDHVWAVGQAALHDRATPLIEHFDGTGWSVVPSHF